MFVSHVNAPNKQSCLQNSPCPTNLFCSPTIITPHEVRLVILDAVNNKINTKNEGIKNGSYARVNARRNAKNILTNPYNPNCCINNTLNIITNPYNPSCCNDTVNIPLKPKSPHIVSSKRILWPS
jgi:hypothetical protein